MGFRAHRSGSKAAAATPGLIPRAHPPWCLCCHAPPQPLSLVPPNSGHLGSCPTKPLNPLPTKPCPHCTQDTSNLERVRKVKTQHQRLAGRVGSLRETLEKYLGGLGFRGRGDVGFKAHVQKWSSVGRADPCSLNHSYPNHSPLNPCFKK